MSFMAICSMRYLKEDVVDRLWNAVILQRIRVKSCQKRWSMNFTIEKSEREASSIELSLDFDFIQF